MTFMTKIVLLVVSCLACGGFQSPRSRPTVYKAPAFEGRCSGGARDRIPRPYSPSVLRLESPKISDGVKRRGSPLFPRKRRGGDKVLASAKDDTIEEESHTNPIVKIWLAFRRLVERLWVSSGSKQ